MNGLKELKKQPVQPLYVMYGPESFWLEAAKQQIIASALGTDDPGLNVAVFDLAETPLDTMLDEAETLPFLGEKKVVIGQNPVFLTAEKTKIDHDIKRLEAYAVDPAPFTVMVLTGLYEKLDERKKITKLLKAHAHLVEAKRPTEKELSVWLKERAREEGAAIGDEAIGLLLSIAGLNVSVLAMEIEKLTIHAGAGGDITAEAVRQLTARTLESDIFRLVDAIVNGHIEEALRIYYDLIRLNEEPLKILAIVAGQFRLIYQVKELAKKGYSQQQIAAQLKVHPFRVKLAGGQTRFFSDSQLARIMMMLAECDEKMKSSVMDKKMIMELFFFQLQSMRKQERNK